LKGATGAKTKTPDTSVSKTRKTSTEYQIRIGYVEKRALEAINQTPEGSKYKESKKKGKKSGDPNNGGTDHAC